MDVLATCLLKICTHSVCRGSASLYSRLPLTREISQDYVIYACEKFNFICRLSLLVCDVLYSTLV